MSHMNTNVRSLRDQFQQQQQQTNQYSNVTQNRPEQKHDILFQCIHCEIVQSPFSAYNSQISLQNIKEENKSTPIFRQISIISEKEDEETPSPLHRSNYALDFRHLNNENNPKKSIEQNIKGFVDGCVRSSLNEMTYVNRVGDSKDIVEVEVEYDPILGNVKSTRKRSSTIITNLDNDYHPTNYRHQSAHNRNKPLSSDVEHDNTIPIWARRRVSHSTVKPSDLVRESDKKEKLQATALRRLSRTDLAGDGVIPNSTTRPKISTSRIFFYLYIYTEDNYSQNNTYNVYLSSQNPSTIKDTILRWCQDLTQFYKGINIKNFSSSWSDGLAFCAIIHRYFPDEFNFDTLIADEPRQNFELAFTVALERAGIEPLIDIDDMILMGAKPDWKVVFTYVQSLYRHLSRIQPPAILRERW
ncbi:unnamed protein product [Rotaria sordida]|uniref:Calponin-homology (CH) domain-containing protein n=1 Tax=Rotaria sordida TaxID=392033 RepID=A0A819HFM6_9BILA|nr:unnamed protein product [Rotaria sordida]